MSIGDFDLKKETKFQIKCQQCGMSMGEVEEETHQYMLSTNTMKCIICNRNDDIRVDIKKPIPK
ncbi:MAG: hypothetical protein KAS32_03360 [Candidatus Peribacteraceae bacterium]|nr:hypothetical protein [Candidatus Peribacteraceae bacterium]